ncbi:hypothetical protein GCM10023165_41070 [Variovorax defluvii]|uniref:Uncharacterized protein n=1 Tax=Variovorax defluvii TaxID=913761 RepID=A0ABP8I624_9BURK
MNTLPLDCLVAHFLASECGPASRLDEEQVYAIPIDETYWLGVQKSEAENSLLFFAHPGPAVPSHHVREHDEETSERYSEELDLGDDEDGSWVLTADRSTGSYTLWISAKHPRVGHVEFARIVSNLRWRFSIWNEVLTSGNDGLPKVTEEVPAPPSRLQHGFFFA